MSTHVEAAKAIRKELKVVFPKVKFSVTSKSFTGGDKVVISWIDAIITNQVETITNKYQMGHFDGMIGCYEYSNRRDDIPQVKYVNVSRKISEEAQKILIKEHNEKTCIEGQIKNINDWNENAKCYNNQLIWKLFSVREF